MIKPEELYGKTKILVDMELLNKLLEKYASIPINELNFSLSADEGYKITLGYSRLSSALYNQINCLQQTTAQNEKLRIDKENFILKVRQDFINNGINFNPELHGGSTNPLTVQPDWYTFKSWNLLGTEKIHNSNQLHRFYIGAANNDKYDFANELYSEFKHVNIPFYFKVDRFSENRPDKIVIYTSTDLLGKTMEVLARIENRRSDLMQNCVSPSIIVGKVTDKIGYASELPSNGFSFTQIICNCLANAIDSTINEYIKGSIKASIKKVYDEKVLEIQKRGYFLEIGGKKKIAAEVLMEQDSIFKAKLLDTFRSNLINAGLDLNNMCFSKEAKKEIEKQYNPMKKNKIDIFDPDVLNQVITLPNGKIMTIDEYLQRNRIWSLVPLNATVMFRSLGISMSGTKFIENVIKRANQFIDIQEFFKAYDVVVNRNDFEEKGTEMINQNLGNDQKGFEENIHTRR